MSSKLTGPNIITGAPGTSATRTTTAQETVGQVMRDATGRELRYVKAGGAIGAGVPVSLSGGASAAVASTNAKGYDGVAEDAFESGEYGWIVTAGAVLALVPSGTAVGDPLVAGNGAFAAAGASDLPTKGTYAQEAAPLLSGTTQSKLVFIP